MSKESKENPEKIRIEHIAINNLTLFAGNPKKHPPEQIEKIVRSIEEFGWTNPVLAIKHEGKNIVVAGHARLEAAAKKGLQTVPVIFLDMPFKKAIAYNVADNRLAELASWDTDALASLLESIQGSGFDLELMGFSAEEFSTMKTQQMEIREDDFDVDAAMKEPPITKMGDLWVLGKHRLLCGDSTKKEDVEKLMNGVQANMILTSPPYLVGKEYEKGRTLEQQLEMMKKNSTLMHSITKNGGYYFLNFGDIHPQNSTKILTGEDDYCSYHIAGDYYKIFRNNGWLLYAMRIWQKPFQRLMKPYWSFHTTVPHHMEWEYLWTWRKKGGGKEVVRNWELSVRSVWDKEIEDKFTPGHLSQYPLKDSVGGGHKAAFPVYLPTMALMVYTDIDDLILDP